MIIHICGSSGSGKTYIGNMFKNKINVIDLDDWTEEFNKKTLKTKKTFMLFIDEKLKKLIYRLPWLKEIASADGDAISQQIL
jgi:dephospho-CoA kinase